MPLTHLDALLLPARRTLLAQALAVAGLCVAAPVRAFSATHLLVENVTGLYSVAVARIALPNNTEAVAGAVRAWRGRVAVGGGRYSMGGQVAVDAGLHLDMRSMNRVVWIRPADKRVRVQAGMRWRDLQDVLDPLNLSIKTMQSYSNFTVGGSVSVNAHGRYVGRGPLGNTVHALQLVMADGSVVEASRSAHTALLRAAIGGYGAVGVITEIELELADNLRIERLVKTVALVDYVAYFDRSVLADSASVMHNADLLPPYFDTPHCVTWRATDQPLTDTARLVPRGQSYGVEQSVLWALTELPAGDRVRKNVLQPVLTARAVVQWLNHEASLDVAELEPRTRRISTYVLQEFFIPRRRFLPFARAMGTLLHSRGVEALNVSVRHSPADALSLMPWAKEEVFSFVLYFKQRTHAAAQQEVGQWTRELIDLALANGGRYYLPYQLHATVRQFNRAYPEAEALRALKREVDPSGKFSNQLWSRYL
jgi:FAD/FMN-containing dehydrogenase